MKTNKNHLAIRYEYITLCGINHTKHPRIFWADAVKIIKSNPDYKGIKICKNCEKISKIRKIKQLTAEECRKA